MSTGQTDIPVLGTFAPKRSEIPSSGWMRIVIRFG
jgi:hypothetical protein